MYTSRSWVKCVLCALKIDVCCAGAYSEIVRLVSELPVAVSLSFAGAHSPRWSYECELMNEIVHIYCSVGAERKRDGKREEWQTRLWTNCEKVDWWWCVDGVWICMRSQDFNSENQSQKQMTHRLLAAFSCIHTYPLRSHCIKWLHKLGKTMRF